jgi:predicted small lipoprotein YifL
VGAGLKRGNQAVAVPLHEPGKAGASAGLAPYNSAMRKLSCLLLVALLAACGMKGDLFEKTPPPPVDEPAPVDTDEDKGERKTIPADPDPALSR